jgi:hypothetical protein
MRKSKVKNEKPNKKLSKSLQSINDFFANKKPLRVTYTDKQGNVVTKLMMNSEMKKLRKK